MVKSKTKVIKAEFLFPIAIPAEEYNCTTETMTRELLGEPTTWCKTCKATSLRSCDSETRSCLEDRVGQQASLESNEWQIGQEPDRLQVGHG